MKTVITRYLSPSFKKTGDPLKTNFKALLRNINQTFAFITISQFLFFSVSVAETSYKPCPEIKFKEGFTTDGRPINIEDKSGNIFELMTSGVYVPVICDPNVDIIEKKSIFRSSTLELWPGGTGAIQISGKDAEMLYKSLKVKVEPAKEVAIEGKPSTKIKSGRIYTCFRSQLNDGSLKYACDVYINFENGDSTNP